MAQHDLLHRSQPEDDPQPGVVRGEARENLSSKLNDLQATINDQQRQIADLVAQRSSFKVAKDTAEKKLKVAEHNLSGVSQERDCLVNRLSEVTSELEHCNSVDPDFSQSEVAKLKETIAERDEEIHRLLQVGGELNAINESLRQQLSASDEQLKQWPLKKWSVDYHAHNLDCVHELKASEIIIDNGVIIFVKTPGSNDIVAAFPPGSWSNLIMIEEVTDDETTG